MSRDLLVFVWQGYQEGMIFNREWVLEEQVHKNKPERDGQTMEAGRQCCEERHASPLVPFVFGGFCCHRGE